MQENKKPPFKIDMTNTQMGNWLVLTFVKMENSNSIWTCRCCYCGNTRDLTREQLRRAKKSNRKYCWKCFQTPNRNTKPGFRTRHFTRIKNRARNDNIKFDVTENYLRKLFNKQNGLCALSGEILYFEISSKISNTTTASLDRIDSTKGYVKGNVQWVHRDVNKIKWVLPQKEFLNWCELISDHNP